MWERTSEKSPNARPAHPAPRPAPGGFGFVSLLRKRSLESERHDYIRPKCKSGWLLLLRSGIWSNVPRIYFTLLLLNYT